MMPVSVRARLTLTIAVLAAVLSLGAVWFGTNSVEANLIDEALSDRASQYLVPQSDAFNPVGFDPTTETIFIDSEPFPTGEILSADILGGEIFGGGIVTAETLGVDTLDERILPGGAVATEVFGSFEEAFGMESLRVNMAAELAAEVDLLDRAGLLDDVAQAIGPRSTGPIDFVSQFGIVRYNLAARTGKLLPANEATIDLGPNEAELLGIGWPAIPADSELAMPMGELVNLSNALLESAPGGRVVIAGDAPVLAYRETTSSDAVTFGVLAEVSERIASIEQVRRSLWMAAAVLIILATVVTWLLTGRALREVDVLTQRVSEISAGTLGERVPVPKTQDEIHHLAKTMNAMLDRIELGDHERRRFVADASHELRTPVAILRSEAEIAQRIPEQTEVTDLADSVLAETNRLGALVEDLLALARHDEVGRAGASATQVLSQDLAPVDLDEVVFEDAARSRRVEPDVGQVSGGRVRGSRDELAQAVAHLFDNAARHAVSRVVVGVQTDAERNVVELSVDDDGTGIAPDKRARVFDRFVRLDDARARDTGGAGLGLAVVQATVQRLGGDVTIQDSTLGGARVLVELPAAEYPSEAP